MKLSHKAIIWTSAAVTASGVGWVAYETWRDCWWGHIFWWSIKICGLTQ